MKYWSPESCNKALSHQTCRFPLGGQTSIGREPVHRLGQRAAQPREQLVTRDSCLLREPANLLLAQRLFELGRRNRPVCAACDPRYGLVALTVLLEFFDQIAETATEDASRLSFTQ